jgi:hypothetical protein
VSSIELDTATEEIAARCSALRNILSYELQMAEEATTTEL